MLIQSDIVNAAEIEIDYFNIFGSDGVDRGLAITSDNDNNLFLTGTLDYPLRNQGISGPGTLYEGPFYDTDRSIFEEYPTTNGLDQTYGGLRDGFVTKLGNTGEIIWSTYIGGSEEDNPVDIVVSEGGEVIITGSTASPNFPNTHSNLTGFKGILDGFITKLDNEGKIIFSRVFGGIENDIFNGVSIDSEGNIIAIGRSDSLDFPTQNGIQNNYIGQDDGAMIILVKLSPQGEVLFSTYIGGSIYDFGYDIGVLSDNSIVITGWTKSPDFPYLGGYEKTLNGKSDGFLAKLDPQGKIIWSTYFGGFLIDVSRTIEIDLEDNIIISGFTLSDNFPTTTETPEINNNNGLGTADAFLSKFDLDGNLIFSTFIGGIRTDEAQSIGINSANEIYITGLTFSIDYPIYANLDEPPLFNNANDEEYSERDVILTKLSATGEFMFSIYYGGLGGDWGTAITIDKNDRTVILGFTDSISFGTYGTAGTLSLENMHLSFFESSTIPIASTFPKIELIPDKNDFNDQSIVKTSYTIIALFFSIFLIRLFIKKYREKQFAKATNLDYRQRHAEMERMLNKDN